MEDSKKKIVLTIVVIVAVLAAAFSIYKTVTADQLRTGVVHQSPAKSLKQLEMERQAREDAAAKGGGAPAGKEADDFDASGAIPRGDGR